MDRGYPAATDVAVRPEIDNGICGYRVLCNRFYYPDGVPYIGTNTPPVSITMTVEADNIFVPAMTGFWCRDCDHYTMDRDHFGECCKGVEDTDVIVCPNCETVQGARFAVMHLRKCYGGKD